MTMIEVGAKVVCKGKYAREFSLDGKVERVIQDPLMGTVYGVRLVDGNYLMFLPKNVKEAAT